MLAQRLKELLAARSETANAAAKRIDVPQSTFSLLVRGEKQNPELDTLRAIADGFGVTIGWLIGETAEAAAVERAYLDRIGAIVDDYRLSTSADESGALDDHLGSEGDDAIGTGAG